VNLFLAQATPIFEDRLTRAALPVIPKEKLDRMKRCRVAQQRTCMALSEVLLAWAVQEVHGLTLSKDHRVVGEHGKPMFRVDTETIDFNISHSGSFVLVGIDEHPLGVDIQQWGRDDDRVARKIMLPGEYSDWVQSPNKKVDFYDFWTRTESRLKWQGDGIAGLGEGSVLLPDCVSVHPVTVTQGYSAAVCGQLSRSLGALNAQEIDVEVLLALVERKQQSQFCLHGLS